MSDSLGPDQGEKDVVVLTALVPVYRGYCLGEAEHWVVSTSLFYHVSYQVLLSVVGSKDCYIFAFVSCP